MSLNHMRFQQQINHPNIYTKPPTKPNQQINHTRRAARVYLVLPSTWLPGAAAAAWVHKMRLAQMNGIVAVAAQMKLAQMNWNRDSLI